MRGQRSGVFDTDNPFTEVMSLVTQMYKQTAIAKVLSFFLTLAELSTKSKEVFSANFKQLSLQLILVCCWLFYWTSKETRRNNLFI